MGRSNNSEIEKAHRIALWNVAGIGTVTLKRLLILFESAINAWRADYKEWMELGIQASVCKSFADYKSMNDPEEYYESLLSKEIRTLVLDIDDDYPKNLKMIKNAPMVLYFRGDQKPQDDNCIAVVGSRNPSEYGIRSTRKIVAELVGAGMTIVSGLARGIDITSHRTAVEYGGRTVAFLGGGINKIYPSEHVGFVSKMLSEKRGVIYSVLGPNESSKPGMFAARNRLIAGISKGVLVIEGAEKSGTRITCEDAIGQGKPVFALPGQIDSLMSQAPLKMIQNGAEAIGGAGDILKYFGMNQLEDSLNEVITKPTFSNPTQETIWEMIKGNPLDGNDIARQMNLSISEISQHLSIMEIEGLIRRSGEKYCI